MAAIIPDNGLQRIGVQASQATAGTGPTYNASRHIQTMSVDDSAGAFASGHDALDDAGAVSNEADAATTNTRSGQVISHVATFGTGVANFEIKRIALHDDTTTNVTTSSTTLVAGIDAQSLTKTSDFSMDITVDITYTDAS